MRLLHTSDWHLGRTLHGVDLHDAQRAVLQQLCDLVADPPDAIPIDAVLVAGDIYDRAVPPVESVALLADVLTQLTRHTTVILIGGNHDSSIRLGFGSELFTERLQVRTRLEEIGEPILLSDRFGLEALVYPIPYLDPDHARPALAAPDQPLTRSHQSVVGAAVARIRADLDRRREASPGARTVLMAHLFASQGVASDSERTISVGGVDSVRVRTFDGFDLVALGHLHGPQRPVSTTSTVVSYSGSPLRYSFSERNHIKSISLIDLAADGPVTVTDIALNQPRPMAELHGALEVLLTDPTLDRHVDSWLRVTVTDTERPERMIDRVRSRFPHALQVVHSAPSLAGAAPGSMTRLAEQDPRILAGDFIRYVTGTDVGEAELALFEQAFQAVLVDSSVEGGGR